MNFSQVGQGLLERTDYYIQPAIKMADNNGLNFKRSIELSLNFNQVMHGYINLLIKCRAKEH